MISDVRPKRIFYGWYIVAATWGINVLVAAMWGLGISLYFNPIRTEMGWNATTTSVAFSLRQIETGVLSPIAGFLIDRLGARKCMLAGFFILGLAFILLGRVQSLWQFYAAFLLLSIGPSIAYTQAMNAALVNWFRRRRVRAVGLLYTGGSIGGVLLPAVAFSVTSLGWRTTATLAGLFIWATCLPLSAVVRHRPEPYGWTQDGDLPAVEARESPPASAPGREETTSATGSSSTGLGVQAALMTRTFWILTLAQGAYSLATSMILTVHLIPYLESLDIPRAKAASLVTVFMISTFPARFALGWIGDLFDKRRVLSVLYSLSASGTVVLALSHVYWQAVPYAVMAGLAHGGITVLTVVLISECFGTRRFASITGLIHTSSVVGGVAGPLAGGLVFDLTGSYRPVFFAVAVLVGMTAPLILLAKRPQEMTAPEPVASMGG